MAEKNGSACFRTSIGGQALIEGILMRGPEKQAIVVRSPEGLVIKEEKLRLVRDKHPILGLPLIRGAVTFIDSMVKGVQALMFSADYFPDDPNAKPSKVDEWIESHFSDEKAQKLMVGISVVLALLMTIGLFFFLPTFLAGLADPFINSVVIHNLIEGIVKIVIFGVYLILCSKQKDIYRVFQYHGAEHKTIFCYEHGLELTVENVKKERRFHPRCGTSFLVLMLLVGIVIGFFIPTSLNKWIRTAVKLLLLPITMGIGYELIKLCGKHDNWLTRIIAAPGLWFQRLTVMEPDDGMIECAIASIKEVIPEDGSDQI